MRFLTLQQHRTPLAILDSIRSTSSQHGELLDLDETEVHAQRGGDVPDTPSFGGMVKIVDELGDRLANAHCGSYGWLAASRAAFYACAIPCLKGYIVPPPGLTAGLPHMPL